MMLPLLGHLLLLAVLQLTSCAVGVLAAFLVAVDWAASTVLGSNPAVVAGAGAYRGAGAMAGAGAPYAESLID